MANSTDYHDYVFREGKLVGEFEEMYRHSSVVPWNQDKQNDWIDVRLSVEMLREFQRFDEVHDLGCGLGYHLAFMRGQVGAPDCRASGYDISETAILTAGASFPDISFRHLDLTAPADGAIAETKASSRRLFMIRGTIWYVAPKLTEVVTKIRSLMLPADLLLVVQNFPALDQPFVGKDVVPSHAELIRHFSARFVPHRHLWYEDSLKSANDNWFIGLFSPRP